MSQSGEANGDRTVQCVACAGRRAGWFSFYNVFEPLLDYSAPIYIYVFP
jgi:hypothetical protein